ncbi:hypothetical protein TW95_gp0821 [Pandoravirus inopinatum]|uniref:Uncharacterized protein n=1 Tax=Pandoravirus inopinatum TaxID=1605721 RepID=A0A0B5J6X7_9VIRU|nr:hypothetical protein TW95_gp0821 [Pandoravirus inopinatum]AJF97555.1 hypothetical protein [Pandoravirus inopinatum]
MTCVAVAAYFLFHFVYCNDCARQPNVATDALRQSKKKGAAQIGYLCAPMAQRGAGSQHCVAVATSCLQQGASEGDAFATKTDAASQARRLKAIAQQKTGANYKDANKDGDQSTTLYLVCKPIHKTQTFFFLFFPTVDNCFAFCIRLMSIWRPGKHGPTASGRQDRNGQPHATRWLPKTKRHRHRMLQLHHKRGNGTKKVMVFILHSDSGSLGHSARVQ